MIRLQFFFNTLWHTTQHKTLWDWVFVKLIILTQILRSGILNIPDFKAWKLRKGRLYITHTLGPERCSKSNLNLTGIPGLKYPDRGLMFVLIMKVINNLKNSWFKCSWGLNLFISRHVYDVMRVVTVDAMTAPSLYHLDAIYKCGRRPCYYLVDINTWWRTQLLRWESK